MKNVLAMLIKKVSSDGMIEVEGHVRLGKIYLIDLDSKRSMRMYNLVHGRYHMKEVVDVVVDDERRQWFPFELLRVLER